LRPIRRQLHFTAFPNSMATYLAMRKL